MEQDYYFEFIFDGLPAWGYVGEREAEDYILGHTERSKHYLYTYARAICDMHFLYGPPIRLMHTRMCNVTACTYAAAAARGAAAIFVRRLARACWSLRFAYSHALVRGGIGHMRIRVRARRYALPAWAAHWTCAYPVLRRYLHFTVAYNGDRVIALNISTDAARRYGAPIEHMHAPVARPLGMCVSAFARECARVPICIPLCCPD